MLRNFPKDLERLWLQLRGITECWEVMCACWELPALPEKYHELEGVHLLCFYFSFTDGEFPQDQVA